MKHQLKTIDLINFESKTQIAGQFGNGISKSLNIKTIVTDQNEAYSLFTVENHGQVIFSHSNLEMAIKAYNIESGLAYNVDTFSSEEWLKINYNLEPMQILRGTRNNNDYKIESVVKADNIGHWKTKYPVVINLTNSNNTGDDDPKVTIEQLFGH